MAYDFYDFKVGGLYKTPYKDPFFIINMTEDKHMVGIYYGYCPGTFFKKPRPQYKWRRATIKARQLVLHTYAPKKDIALIINAIQYLRTGRHARPDLKSKIIEFLLEA